MYEAIREARVAADSGEIPIGAVVVNASGEIIGRGRNHREKDADVTGHAELAAVREASMITGSWRLDGCTIYVTLEPCFMCASAIQQARIDRLFFAANDPKAGAVVSLCRFYEAYPQNHMVKWQGGLMAEECGEQIRLFFRELRSRNRRHNKEYGGRAQRADAAAKRLLDKPGDKRN